MGLPPSWINQERWDVDPIVTLSVPSSFFLFFSFSFFFFTFSFFLREEVHGCLWSGDGNAETAAAAVTARL